MASSADLSVIVMGATGVTGKQAVPYVRERAAEGGFRWGIAGRSRERLEALVADWPEPERPEIFVADVDVPETVAAAVGRCRAIVNFAGPFARMAPRVIEACVDAGIAYVDVTGEIDFAAEIVNRHHAAAEASGARIVQVCGFEALPFDLLALAAIERLEELGEQAAAVDAIVSLSGPPGMPLPSDMVSNGTFESLREAMAGDGAKVLGDPAALVGDLASAPVVRAASPIRNRPRREPGVGMLAPMIPSPVINPPVIQRSLALAGRTPLPYREAVAAASLVPTAPLQAIVAGFTGALNGGLAMMVKAPAPVRRAGAAAMKPFAPSGGPRQERLAAWSWRIETTARSASGTKAVARLDADGHPGYLATSRMTAEAGLLLADPDAATPRACRCADPGDRARHSRTRPLRRRRPALQLGDPRSARAPARSEVVSSPGAELVVLPQSTSWPRSSRRGVVRSRCRAPSSRPAGRRRACGRRPRQASISSPPTPPPLTSGLT